MRRKILSAISSAIVGSTLFASAVCSASVPANQLVVDGIECGSTVQAVENSFDKPDAIRKDKFIYYSADGNAALAFKIKDGTVHEMKCRVHDHSERGAHHGH